jgi:hypothetical protein
MDEPLHVGCGSKLRKTRSEHYISGLPPIADIQRNQTHPCLARRLVAVRRFAGFKATLTTKIKYSLCWLC